MNRVDRIVLDPIRTYACTRTARTGVRVTALHNDSVSLSFQFTLLNPEPVSFSLSLLASVRPQYRCLMSAASIFHHKFTRFPTFRVGQGSSISYQDHKIGIRFVLIQQNHLFTVVSVFRMYCSPLKTFGTLFRSIPCSFASLIDPES